MTEALTFQRIYRDANGPEYPASPEVVRTVLHSMNQHADGPDPFHVRFRVSDGSTVTARPRRRR